MDLEGGILVANHPFRYKLDPRFSFINPDSRADRSGLIPIARPSSEIFEMVDAIEVLNGACSEDENVFALKVARDLGLRRGRGLRFPFGEFNRMRDDAARRAGQAMSAR